MDVLKVLGVALISYLVGNANFALLISKFHKSSDVRSYGSGNAGMTNMLRVYGKRAAAWTFIGDFLKGFATVFIAQKVCDVSILNIGIGYIAATFVLLGHIYPVFFQFRGGKGIATALGAILAIDWVVALTIYLGVVPMVFIVKIVSVVSLCGTALYPVLTLMFGVARNEGILTSVVPKTAMASIMAGIVIFAHRDNIKRITEGKEKSFGEEKDE